jgi:hypothetical protein
MKTYDTLSEAVNDLQQNGYGLNFNLAGDCLHCAEYNLKLHPDDFHIDNIYRFEGMNDPGDSNIVYAISSVKYKAKGIFVSAYGAYDEGLSAPLLSKLAYR